jgi:hypothetical protein
VRAKEVFDGNERVREERSDVLFVFNSECTAAFYREGG